MAEIADFDTDGVMEEAILERRRTGSGCIIRRLSCWNVDLGGFTVIFKNMN